MVDKPGPTGDYPQGKLDEFDEGGLNIMISSHQGVVRLDFGKKTAWIGLPPDEALAFASVIVKHAMKLKGQQI